MEYLCCCLFLFVRAILCRGLEYPPVHPRPVMGSLSLKVPLCEPDLERTEHEVGKLYLLNSAHMIDASGYFVLSIVHFIYSLIDSFTFAKHFLNLYW